MDCKQTTARQWVRILSSIVEPATSFLLVSVFHNLHRDTARAKLISSQRLRLTVALHSFPKEFRAGLEIAKRRTLCHSTRLGQRPAPLEPVLSDRTILLSQSGLDSWSGCCQTNANQSLQGQLSYALCRTELTPLSESGGAVEFEIGT